ncbi:hypothetical protein CAPTEDRAFT_218475 [Capitella teleta]|uniref:Uncharacterized protein n=1 Tax=Capitella teleta TaxID=283909 RepID=R7VJI9_CAPTE|nr:hypothetical protein CAPTEDRAFT_218475 [Capitella teleta]|eukprot:ELU18747.1 hypothetical protein CAPTEDRAFT_218475 [Capitella teleta]
MANNNKKQRKNIHYVDSAASTLSTPNPYSFDNPNGPMSMPVSLKRTDNEELYEEIADVNSVAGSSTLPPQLNPIAQRHRPQVVRNYETEVKQKTRIAHQSSPRHERRKAKSKANQNLGFDAPTEDAHVLYGTSDYNPMSLGYAP